MTSPGVYKHYKAGRLYRVLFVATWAHSEEWIVSDADLLTFVSGPAIFVQRAPETTGGYFRGTPLVGVKWSGNDGHLHAHNRLVVYVGLYGQGRVSARTLKEFEENVDVPCADGVVDKHTAPRFERIGA